MGIGRYVPPAFRHQQQENRSTGAYPNSTKCPQASDTLPIRTLEDLRFEPSKSRHENPRAHDPDAQAVEEIHMQFAGQTYQELTRSNLNDSLEYPMKLAYVILFKDAHPRWDSDRIIAKQISPSCPGTMTRSRRLLMIVHLLPTIRVRTKMPKPPRASPLKAPALTKSKSLVI